MQSHPLDMVLGRPTRDSVTLSVLVYEDAEGRIAYGTQRGRLRPTNTDDLNGSREESGSAVVCSPTRSYLYKFQSPP